jgi:hypothetical protein
LPGLQRVAECGMGSTPGDPIQARPQSDVIRVEAVEHSVFCDGCGVEITWVPIVSGGRRYCCSLCTRGGDCGCGYAVENEDEEGPAILES